MVRMVGCVGSARTGQMLQLPDLFHACKYLNDFCPQSFRASLVDHLIGHCRFPGINSRVNFEVVGLRT